MWNFFHGFFCGIKKSKTCIYICLNLPYLWASHDKYGFKQEKSIGAVMIRLYRKMADETANRHPGVRFVDMKKIIDSVSRTILFQKLKARWILNKIRACRRYRKIKRGPSGFAPTTIFFQYIHVHWWAFNYFSVEVKLDVTFADDIAITFSIQDEYTRKLKSLQY